MEWGIFIVSNIVVILLLVYSTIRSTRRYRSCGKRGGTKGLLEAFASCLPETLPTSFPNREKMPSLLFFQSATNNRSNSLTRRRIFSTVLRQWSATKRYASINLFPFASINLFPFPIILETREWLPSSNCSVSFPNDSFVPSTRVAGHRRYKFHDDRHRPTSMVGFLLFSSAAEQDGHRGHRYRTDRNAGNGRL